MPFPTPHTLPLLLTSLPLSLTHLALSLTLASYLHATSRTSSCSTPSTVINIATGETLRLSRPDFVDALVATCIAAPFSALSVVSGLLVLRFTRMSMDAVLVAIMLVVVVGSGLLQAGWVGVSINDSSPTLTKIQCRVLPQDFNARKYEKDVRTRLGVANAVIVGVMFLISLLHLFSTISLRRHSRFHAAQRRRAARVASGPSPFLHNVNININIPANLPRVVIPPYRPTSTIRHVDAATDAERPLRERGFGMQMPWTAEQREESEEMERRRMVEQEERRKKEREKKDSGE